MKYRYHFIAPVLSYLIPLMRGDGNPTINEVALFFLPNVLFLSIPYLLIIGIGKLCKTERNTILSQLIGVHFSLVCILLLIMQDHSNAAAFGWVYYYPMAILTVLVISILAKHENKYNA